ncbi:3'5'-cyclic nucleotide phosphodiesterase [Carpediemonas membranifera]|uniref:Phosphodiesterase n=1 Tax=Carpediemonas membranifera TaxID=201153 RepID=A0A8J6E0W9_9EUKA|nr:3'5'-cyclic nucleotide phosphodiesterase [Carpediemonas membranifera]|eukprot:KAG9392738.1 3'5'-cyclic nucleotide phosphodiesterase [Carpediemonas membranifera]
MGQRLKISAKPSTSTTVQLLDIVLSYVASTYTDATPTSVSAFFVLSFLLYCVMNVGTATLSIHAVPLSVNYQKPGALAEVEEAVARYPTRSPSLASLSSSSSTAKNSASTTLQLMKLMYKSSSCADIRHALMEAMVDIRGCGGVINVDEDEVVISSETRRFLTAFTPTTPRRKKHGSFGPDSLGSSALMRQMTVRSLPGRTIAGSDLRACYRDIVNSVSASCERWNFDALALALRHDRYLLVSTTYQCLHALDIVSEFSLDEGVLNCLLLAIEAGYYNNEYHCSAHATDVVQAVYWMLSCEGAGMGDYLTPLEKFALIFAAAIHDYGHIGVNNAFISNYSGPISIRYSDRSNLEAFSLACVFQIMSDPAYSLISDDDTRLAFRDLVISCVLATDMAKHNDEVHLMKEKLASGAFTAPITEAADGLLLMKLIMKAADVSNPARPRLVYLAWTKRIVSEFFVQGDAEKALGQPLGPCNDRAKLCFRSNQRGFIDFVTRPLFQMLQEIAPEPCRFKCVLANLTANYNYWDSEESVNFSSMVKARSQFKACSDEIIRRTGKPLESVHVPRLSGAGGMQADIKLSSPSAEIKVGDVEN